MKNHNIYKNTCYDTIIIGSGPTGLYGGFYCGLKHLNTLIIEINNTYGGAPARLYPEKPLYDIPGCVNITGAELVQNMYKQLESMDYWEIIYNTEIIKITQYIEDDKIYYLLCDSNNNVYQTKNIIFATGYGAFEFIKFEEHVDISHDAKIAYYIEKFDKYKNKDIVICGGGDSAVDFANALKGIAKSIKLIHRRNEFRAKQANVEKLKGSVKTYLNKSIKTINHNKISFIDNESNELDEIKYDELLVLFGTKMVPNNIDLKDLYNNVFKILINPVTLESVNYKNIFACGLASNIKCEQTIVTGISDVIKVIASIAKTLKSQTA